LFGTSIRILRQRRLRAFLSKMLTSLPKRLGHTRHRLDDVLLAHVQSRRDLFRRLFHHRSMLSIVLVSPRRIAARADTC